MGLDGNKRNPFFFIQSICNFFRKNKSNAVAALTDEGSANLDLSESDSELMDKDVLKAAQDAFSSEASLKSVLLIQNVSKTFSDGKVAVKNVSFGINSGIVFGLLGPNGAGKSTLIQMLVGAFQPSEGRIFIDGMDTQIHHSSISRILGR